MRDLGHREHAAEGFGGFDGGGADEDGLSALVGFSNLLDGKLVLLLAGLEDDIVIVDADARTVRRDGDNGQPVDVIELGSLGLGGAGHARELLVHTEVVLNRDRRVGLIFLLERDAFLGFDGLVEAVGPAATFHDAAGVFVDDLHLALMDDILLVLFVERVGLEQLADGVDIFGCLGVGGFGFAPEFGAAFVGQRLVVIEFDVAARQVGQHERVGFAGAQRVASELGKVGLVVAFADGEVETLLEVEAAVLLDLGGEHAFVLFE